MKTTTTETRVLSPEEADDQDFAVFNSGPHLCVDVPDDHSTISVKLSNGRKITFAFIPYRKNGIPQCVDIHDNGLRSKTEDGEREAQSIIAFTEGGTAFRANGNEEDPVTLTSILLG